MISYGCPYCQMDTAGNHEDGCPGRPTTTATRPKPDGVGWQCPICGASLSPWMYYCPFCAPRRWSVMHLNRDETLTATPPWSNQWMWGNCG